MKKAIVVFALLIASVASGQTHVTTDRDGTFLGAEVINPTTSTAFTPPAGSEWAVFSVRAAGIHVNFDGTASTTSKLYLPPGLYRTAYVARGNPAPTIALSAYRLIDSSDGASTVYISYFKRP